MTAAEGPLGVAVIGVSPVFRNRTVNGHPVGNAGNMIHAVSARRLLRRPVEVPRERLWTPEEVERIRATASHILYVGANGVLVGAESSPLEPLQRIEAANIRAAGLPVAVLGLGAQAPENRFETPLTLPAGTLDLLRALAEHAVAIGVRGNFTARVLEAAGIGEVAVLGCQSCYMSLDPDFADRLDPTPPAGPAEVVGSYTYPLRERALVDLLYRHDIALVGQEEHYEWGIANGAVDPVIAAGPRAARLAAALAELGIGEEDYAAYLRRRFHQFEDVDAWLAWLGRFRMAVGTRFHGNMAALQAGVPALWVRHDSRTRELTWLHGLPSIALREVAEFDSLAALRDRIDLAPFRARYRAGFAALRDYLDRAGIDHRLPGGGAS